MFVLFNLNFRTTYIFCLNWGFGWLYTVAKGTSRVVLRAKTRVWGPRLGLGIKLGLGPDQIGLGLVFNQLGWV